MPSQTEDQDIFYVFRSFYPKDAFLTDQLRDRGKIVLFYEMHDLLNAENSQINYFEEKIKIERIFNYIDGR